MDVIIAHPTPVYWFLAWFVGAIVTAVILHLSDGGLSVEARIWATMLWPVVAGVAVLLMPSKIGVFIAENWKEHKEHVDGPAANSQAPTWFNKVVEWITPRRRGRQPAPRLEDDEGERR